MPCVTRYALPDPQRIVGVSTCPAARKANFTCLSTTGKTCMWVSQARTQLLSQHAATADGLMLLTENTRTWVFRPSGVQLRAAWLPCCLRRGLPCCPVRLQLSCLLPCHTHCVGRTWGTCASTVATNCNAVSTCVWPTAKGQLVQWLAVTDCTAQHSTAQRDNNLRLWYGHHRALCLTLQLL